MRDLLNFFSAKSKCFTVECFLSLSFTFFTSIKGCITFCKVPQELIELNIDDDDSAKFSQSSNLSNLKL